MGMLKEFRDFAMKGNLIDLAVAFVMGAAFVKVITAFTEGIIAPLVGLLTGTDLKAYMWVIKPEVRDAAGVVTAPAVAVKWGAFITTVLDFIIVAFVVFLIVRAINNLKKKKEEVPAPPAEEIVLLREIRDALRK